MNYFKRTLLFLVLVLLISFKSTSAMYHPETGRFIQQDPIGVRDGTAIVYYSGDGKPSYKRQSISSQFADGICLYEYVNSSPIRSSDLYGLMDPITFPDMYKHKNNKIDRCSIPLHWQAMYHREIGTDITEKDDLGKNILAQMKDTESVKSAIAELKRKAKDEFIISGKSMGCPLTTKYWRGERDVNPTIELIEESKRELYLTIKHYTLYAHVRCWFIKQCCDKECSTDLPKSPCGEVKGYCAVRLHMHDRHDFAGALTPFAWYGNDYNIDIKWHDRFELGPEILCPDENK